MAVDPIEFASVFLNSFCVLAANMLCAYLALRAFFPKRHAPYLFWSCFLTKISLVALVDAMGWFGVAGDQAAAIRVVVTLLGVVLYLVLYYTWDGGLLNVWVIALAIDYITALTLVITLGVLGYLFEGGFSLAYIGLFGPVSICRAALELGSFWVLFQLLKPLGWRVAEYSFKHERAEGVGVVFLVGITGWTTGSSIESSGMFGSLWVPFVGLPVIAFIAGSYLVWRWHMVQMRQRRLARQKALMSACDQMMGNQSAVLGQSRGVLDGLAERIDQAGAGGPEGLRQQVDALRQVCDRLRFGTYSDNPTLDVVLLGYEERFRKAGCQVAYRVAPLCASGEQVALAARGLLEWAFQMKAHAGGREDTDARRKAAKGGGISPLSDVGADVVNLHMFRRANQILLEARVSAGGSWRLSRAWLKGGLPPECVVVGRKRDGDAWRVRLAVEVSL